MSENLNSPQHVFLFSTQKNTSFEIKSSRLNMDQKITIKNRPLNGGVKIRANIIKYTPNESFIGTDFFSFVDIKGKEGLIVINTENTVFKPRARLLIQLGNQLIKNESIALIELVKNAYDADANNCIVNMQNVDHRDSGIIIIEDDGSGMDIQTVKNSWLEPGSDIKEKIVNDKLYSPKGRLPIGEKGIGRFGVHKLGKEIELITRKAGCNEVVVKINWEEFETYKYLNNAPVTLFERPSKVFKGNFTGTKIIIKNLSKNWTRGMLREVFRAINAISIPTSHDINELVLKEEVAINKKGKTDKSFDAKLITNKTEWIKDIPTWKEIIEYALFLFEIEIKDDLITKFTYRFCPWENMPIKGREVKEKDGNISKLLDILDSSKRKATPLNVPPGIKIGKIHFSGCIFIRDVPILKLFSGKNPNVVKNYLDENGGIRIYRNGMRVYDYGEKENDWLDLDYRRFNDPGVKISNNLMLASINLDREQSKDLIEKTNREGFIDNEAYHIFKKQIIYTLKLVEILRLEDKKRIDAIYKKIEKKFEPVLKSIENLKSIVVEKVRNSDIKKEILIYVDTIEKNYRFMNDTLVKSASAGLGWSVYIHEIEKIISEIAKLSKRENASNRLLKLITHLSNLIESYAQILRKSARTNENLVSIIEQALFNIEFRLKAHNIQIISEYKKIKKDYKVKITKNLIIANIMNIIDNSIYWLDRSGRKDKKIFIGIGDSESFISVIIADNGTGFALPIEEITEPFVSAKPGGMGLGLHIIREVMEGQSGKITFNEYNDYKIPNNFKNGATVILNFKK